MRNSLFNLALEDEAVVGAATAGAEAGAGVESAETALVDVNEGAAVVEATNAEVEQAGADADALDNIADAVEGTIEEGGLTESAANAVNVAVEAFYTRLNIVKKPVVVMEHFGNASSRVQATRLTMEGIKEVAKDVWKKIIAFIKKIGSWIMDQYNKVFGAAEKLEKRAKALQARAENADLPAKAKEEKIENETLAKALHIGGTVGNVAASYKAMFAIIQPIFGAGFEAINTNVESYLAGLEKMATAGAYSDDFKVVKDLPAVAVGPAADAETTGHTAAKEGVKFHLSDALPGGKAIVSYLPDGKATGAAAVVALRESKSSIGAANLKDIAKVTSKFSVIPKGELAGAAEDVAKAAGELKAFRNKSSKLKTMISDIGTTAGKMEKEADSQDDATKSAVIKECGKALSSVASYCYTQQYTASVYLLNVSKSALDVVELSIKQYEASKA